MARVSWMLRLDTLVDTLRRLRTVLCAAGRLVVSTSYLYLVVILGRKTRGDTRVNTFSLIPTISRRRSPPGNL